MQVTKKTRIPMTSNITKSSATTMMLDNPYKIVRQLASSNDVVLFSVSGCCMCTIAKCLLFGLGVGLTIIELDHHGDGPEIQAILFHLVADGRHPVSVLFVGGKFLGGIEACTHGLSHQWNVGSSPQRSRCTLALILSFNTCIEDYFTTITEIF